MIIVNDQKASIPKLAQCAPVNHNSASYHRILASPRGRPQLPLSHRNLCASWFPQAAGCPYRFLVHDPWHDVVLMNVPLRVRAIFLRRCHGSFLETTRECRKSVRTQHPFSSGRNGWKIGSATWTKGVIWGLPSCFLCPSSIECSVYEIQQF